MITNNYPLCLLQSSTMLSDDYQLHKHNTKLLSFIARIGLCLFFSLLLLSLIISPIKPHKLFFDKHGRHHRLLGAANLVWLLIGISNIIVYPPTTYIATSDHDDVHIINRKIINSYAIQCLIYDIILVYWVYYPHSRRQEVFHINTLLQINQVRVGHCLIML